MKSKLLLWLALVLSGRLYLSDCPAAIIFPKQAEAYRNIAYRETIAFYRTLPFPMTITNHGERFLTPEHLQLDKLSVTNGFKSYYLDHRLGTSKKLLSMAVTSSGWGYMLMYGTNMLGVIGLEQDHSNHWAFVGATSMGQPDLRWIGLERAEELPQVQHKDYEFRTLNFSGEDSPMIWLHGKSDDILIPISDGYGKWEAYKPYSESEMTKLLKPEEEDELKSGGGAKDTIPVEKSDPFESKTKS